MKTCSWCLRFFTRSIYETRHDEPLCDRCGPSYFRELWAEWRREIAWDVAEYRRLFGLA